MRAGAYRRRGDGILEIVQPPRRLRHAAIAAAISVAGLVCVVALAAALAVSMFAGVPLAAAAVLLLGARVVRGRRSRGGPPRLARVAPVERIGAPPARTVAPPALERTRDVRRSPPAPTDAGAVVISIPGTAASRTE